MVNVGQEVIIRGVVEESVPWGTVSNVRVRLPDGNDVWFSGTLLEEMQKPGDDGEARPRRGASPDHVHRDEIERTFDGMPVLEEAFVRGIW